MCVTCWVCITVLGTVRMTRTLCGLAEEALPMELYISCGINQSQYAACCYIAILIQPRYVEILISDTVAIAFRLTHSRGKRVHPLLYLLLQLISIRPAVCTVQLLLLNLSPLLHHALLRRAALALVVLVEECGRLWGRGGYFNATRLGHCVLHGKNRTPGQDSDKILAVAWACCMPYLCGNKQDSYRARLNSRRRR